MNHLLIIDDAEAPFQKIFDLLTDTEFQLVGEANEENIGCVPSVDRQLDLLAYLESKDCPDEMTVLLDLQWVKDMRNAGEFPPGMPIEYKERILHLLEMLGPTTDYMWHALAVLHAIFLNDHIKGCNVIIASTLAGTVSDLVLSLNSYAAAHKPTVNVVTISVAMRAEGKLKSVIELAKKSMLVTHDDPYLDSFLRWYEERVPANEQRPWSHNWCEQERNNSEFANFLGLDLYVDMSYVDYSEDMKALGSPFPKAERDSEGRSVSSLVVTKCFSKLGLKVDVIDLEKVQFPARPGLMYFFALRSLVLGFLEGDIKELPLKIELLKSSVDGCKFELRVSLSPKGTSTESYQHLKRMFEKLRRGQRVGLCGSYLDFLEGKTPTIRSTLETLRVFREGGDPDWCHSSFTESSISMVW